MTKISESFIQYLWKFKHFNTADLKTASGQSIEIIHPGIHNLHGGPDFLNAQIRIDETLWCGHVEIHRRSSDWFRHGHEGDQHYRNVILHAVVEHDCEVFLQQPNDLSVLELKEYLPWDFWDRYNQWINQNGWIPCEHRIGDVPNLVWTAWKERLLADRLMERVEALLDELRLSKGNWAQITLREFFKAFGFKSNAAAMGLLADSIPYHIIARHRSDPSQVEAILFGQAGLLHKELQDTYPQMLFQEYQILRRKYGLQPMQAETWNFGKVRPHNSPYLRIAQLAAALCGEEHLTTFLLHTDTDQLKRRLVRDVNPYWENHSGFDKITSQANQQTIGKKSAENIIINAACRLQFAFGKFHDDGRMTERAMTNLEKLAPEDNAIINRWKKSGVICSHAGDSQALIQLYNVYCTNESCLSCSVGHQLLNQNPI